MKGIVYKISNADESIVYIGSSTKTLNQRWWGHRAMFKRWMDGKCRCAAMIYHHFKELGIENFNIELISEHEIGDAKELRHFEQLVINKHECVNRYKAYESLEELKEYQGQYREKNKEQLKEQTKPYRDSHKQQKKETDRAYYEKNKIKLQEKVDCECGGRYSKISKATHRKTKKTPTMANRAILNIVGFFSYVDYSIEVDSQLLLYAIYQK